MLLAHKKGSGGLSKNRGCRQLKSYAIFAASYRFVSPFKRLYWKVLNGKLIARLSQKQMLSLFLRLWVFGTSVMKLRDGV